METDMLRIHPWESLIVCNGVNQFFILQECGYPDYSFYSDLASLQNAIKFHESFGTFYYDVFMWDGSKYLEYPTN